MYVTCTYKCIHISYFYLCFTQIYLCINYLTGRESHKDTHTQAPQYLSQFISKTVYTTILSKFYVDMDLLLADFTKNEANFCSLQVTNLLLFCSLFFSQGSFPQLYFKLLHLFQLFSFAFVFMNFWLFVFIGRLTEVFFNYFLIPF